MHLSSSPGALILGVVPGDEAKSLTPLTFSLSPSRVLSAHGPGEKSQLSEPPEEGVVCEESNGVPKKEGMRGSEVSSLQIAEDLPLLTQQQLEATFISTADFLVIIIFRNFSMILEVLVGFSVILDVLV
jgi:hypothetical protein